MLSFINVKGSISVLYFVLPFSTFRQKGNSKPHLTSPSTLFGIPLCMTLIIKNRHQRGASEFQSSHLLLLFFFFTSKVLSKFLSTIPIICQCSKGLSPLMMIVAETWEKTRCRSSAWHKLPVPDLTVKTISFKLQMAAAWCLAANVAINSISFTTINVIKHFEWPTMIIHVEFLSEKMIMGLIRSWTHLNVANYQCYIAYKCLKNKEHFTKLIYISSNFLLVNWKNVSEWQSESQCLILHIG